MAGDKKDTDNAGSIQPSATTGSEDAAGPSTPSVRSTVPVRRNYGKIYTPRVTSRVLIAPSRDTGHLRHRFDR